MSGFDASFTAWARLRRMAVTLPLATGVLLGAATAQEEHTYPRLALGTALVDRWITEKDDPGFLATFQEIYTGSPAEKVIETRRLMRARGYDTWAAGTRFVQVFGPLCATRAFPESDGKLPAWLYDQAKNNLPALLTVATYHNLRDHDCDWILHDVQGDSMCAWGTTCNKLLLNISRWCPKGEWDGRVSKVTNRGLVSWDYGSTVGLNVVEWMCTVVRDSVFLRNPIFAEAFDGIQIEDSFGRDIACLFGYNASGEWGQTPDPRRDGIGLSCDWNPRTDYAEATWSSIDSLLIHFLQPIRDAGFVVRGNGHHLRWLFDHRYRLGEDTLCTQTFTSMKMEQYGDWGGWPYSDSTHGYWFRTYRALEDVYHPRDLDHLEGWDRSVIQSNPRLDWSDSRRERWTRLNLGQCLMGDGLFDGQAYAEDYYFQKYITETGAGWSRYGPERIPEMELPLGRAAGGCQEYRPVPDAKPLYYRHFIRESSGGTDLYTVVVNIWPVELAGVPRRDALWFRGHQTEFPCSRSLLVFHHTPGVSVPPTWAVIRVGGSAVENSIRFDLPDRRDVTLAVFDPSGRKVRTLLAGRLEPGPVEVAWQGDDDRGRRVGAGLYFWSLAAGELQGRGRMLLCR